MSGVDVPSQKLYVVTGKNGTFYYFNDAYAKKQLFSMAWDELINDDDDDDDDDDVKPSMKVYVKDKFANLTLVSTSIMDFGKISKISADAMHTLIDLLLVVELTAA
jgi:hypothetical protein